MAFYLIDKPVGKTSADIVHEVKKLTNASKVGHGGTLDPFATGLLVVATEGHTRLLHALLDERKTYEGVMKFNQTSDTLDPESDVILLEDPEQITLDDVKFIISKHFLGVISQTPPRFSSVKVNGKKAYELARAGVDFQLDPVERKIYQFDVEEVEKDTFKFKVEVSSGTYIRALARDLGKKLNSIGMLTELRRVKVGNVSVEEATTLPELKDVPVSTVLGLDTIEVSDDQMKDLMNGKVVKVEMKIPKMAFIATNGDLELWVASKSMNSYKIKKRIK